MFPIFTMAQLAGQLGVLDVNANAGINPETGAPWQLGDTYRLVFVSSTTRNANSTVIGDYNTHIQTAANAAGVGAVNWYAIASTSSVNARNNTLTTTAATDGAVFLMDGSQVVANNLADLWDGNVDTRIDIDQNGNPNSVVTPIWTTWTAVWTGTASNGTADGTRFLGASNVTIGLSEAELNFWTRRSSHATNTVNLPMYGISEVLTIVIDPLLPVEFVNFKVNARDDRKVDLSWQTVTESNNDYFTIERSTDAITWEEIGEVDGAGNSTEILTYGFIDATPHFGASYYRIKQTDFNGEFDYSIIKSVTSQNEALNLYPNPVIDFLQISSSIEAFTTIRVVDSQGKCVHSSNVKSSEYALDMSSFQSGVYFITVEFPDRIEHTKVIKK